MLLFVENKKAQSYNDDTRNSCFKNVVDGLHGDLFYD